MRAGGVDSDSGGTLRPAAPPLIIAHRGASFERPENTLAAFERAIELRADYVEFDVQPAGDGELVVVHDRLRRLTLAELRRRHADLATLAEVLDLCVGRVGLAVELKHPHAHRRHDPVGRTLAALRARSVDPGGVMVLCFEPAALERVRREAPRLRTVLHLGWRRSPSAASRFWGVGLEDWAARPPVLRRAQSLGLATAVYTVNDRRRMEELAAVGVTAIFTDRPDLLRRTLTEVGQRSGRETSKTAERG
ncbi:MAG: glycerophosphodiester phosphodiesterase [Thermoleophilia bacterium]|nr:glycerophosphodiester phosphodiesterase [Thermoleophilia bacterium]